MNTMVAPLPDEADRLAALRRYDGPDSDPELDEIAALAAELVGVPVAKVVLIEADRLVVRGLSGDHPREVPRDVSFSTHALHADEFFEVPDTLADPRFASGPQVTGAPGIRFYAGSPLTTADGHRIGVLCVIDRYPRCLSPRERSTLVRLARMAMARLELLHANRQLEAERTRLTQQRALFDKAMDTALEGIIVQTPDGRIRHCNRAAAELLGRPREAMLGQYLWDVSAPPRFLARAQRDFALFVARAAQDDPPGARRQLVALRGDGREIDLEAALTLHKGFRGLEVITFFHDISHHKAIEAALVRAEAAAAAKSEFIATVSHEIRTPLNALIGLSDVLIESALDPQQRTWVQTMQASGRHLLRLVNDVLDFSQLQSHQVTLADEAFELQPALDELMATAAALPGAAKLALGATLAPDVPAAIRGDRHRLLQVLTNLVGNAVKFTPSGSVRLRGWTEPAGSGGPDERRLRLEVADSGPGIPAAQAERIFDDFVQADTPGQPLRSGTGLGLAIARRLAQAMGGTLAVANPGEPGARFVLDLPCRPAAAPRPAAPAAAIARSAKPRRVLVAEDTPASQMVIRLLLEGLGHTVEIVDNGPAAVEAFAGGGFDTVLLDLQLPGLDGCSVARTLRAREAATGTATGKARATLVAVSAFSQPRDRDRALAAGMDSYLAKPVRLRDLAALFDSIDRPAA